jgi:hypothetical protein
MYAQKAAYIERAQNMLSEALVRARRSTLLGKNHADTLVYTYNLADLFVAMGRAREAVPLFEEELQGQLQIGNVGEARESAENLLALFETRRELASMRSQHVKIVVDLCKVYGLRVQVSKSERR